jgi:2-polyprenyl-6-methoxyphenol hydroxylase-like FAD-dependent oxidoreductase
MATVADNIRDREHGRVRTLVIGAGVAGLTLAALLRQRGEQPHIVERAGSLDEAGYNIALYPIGSRVLHGLGLFDRLLETSRPARYYELGNGKGEVLHHFDFNAVLSQYGPLLGLKRAELLDVLRTGLGDLPIHAGTTATVIQQTGDEVQVTFHDGSRASFDLVVGADGMHSATRAMVLGPKEWAYWDTGWGCWVTWADEAIVLSETMTEFWSAGFLIGIYPIKGAQGIVIAGPKQKLKEEGRGAFAEQVRHHLRDFEGPVPAVLDALEKDPHPFFWDLHDCRCRRWAVGRVVLLGDAAAGFFCRRRGSAPPWL